MRGRFFWLVFFLRSRSRSWRWQVSETLFPLPPLSNTQIPYLGDRRPQRRHDHDVVERRVAAGVGSRVAGGALLGLEWVLKKEKEVEVEKKLSQLERDCSRERNEMEPSAGELLSLFVTRFHDGNATKMQTVML